MPKPVISPKYNKNNFLTLVALMIFCLLPQSLLAQTGTAVMIDVSSCLQLESTLERYDCYESLAKASVANNSANPVEQTHTLPTLDITTQPSAPAPVISTVVPAVAAAVEPTTLPTIVELAPPARITEENFGLSAEAKTEAESENTDMVELISIISEVHEITPNRHVITLENGQVWRQMSTERYRLRAGQEVRIYPTGWGTSYRLAVARLGSFIQVERTK